MIASSIPATRQAVKRKGAIIVDEGRLVHLAGILICWDQYHGGEIVRKCPACQHTGSVSVDPGQEKLIEAIHCVSDRHWTCIRCQKERDEAEWVWLGARPAGW